MKKIYTGTILIFLLAFSESSHSQIVVNEFSAANKQIILSADGNYYDWMELYNTSSSAINVGGWFLSDNPAQPIRWQIPAGVSIPSHGVQLFFCSQLDTTMFGEYHANFTLTQSDTSEYAILSDGSGTIVDSIRIYPNQVNHSHGRSTDGANTWAVFKTPTPGASNNTQTAYPGYVPKVQYNIPAGFYSGTQLVTLSCPMAGTTIYYTTNGSVPTAASTLYSGTISISANTVVRARAYDNSSVYAESFLETNSYFINETHTLPVLSLTSDQFPDLFGNVTTPIVGSMEYFGTDNRQIFEIDGEYSPHGNDSWAYPQKGVDFNLEDEYGTGFQVEYKMFTTTPRHHYKWLILKAAASDNYPGNTGPSAHIRDAYVQTLAEKFNLNVDLRRMEHALVFINGQYWGVYEIRDKVDKDYFQYYYNQGQKYVDDLTYWGGMIIRYGSDTAWNNLYDFCIHNNLAIPANYTFVSDRLNVMSLIDAIALGMYTVDSDWLNWNTAWWRGRHQPNIVKWKYWLWDEDNTFDLGQNYTGWPTTDTTAAPCDIMQASGFGINYADTAIGPAEGHIVILNALLQNPDFKQLYINRFADLLNTAFACPNMLNHLDTMIARIDPEMNRHCIRWGGTYSEWRQHVQFLRNQISGRCNTINTGIDTCFNVTGPYPVNIGVQPYCGGTVTVNTITPVTYPFAANYFGGIKQTFKANPNTGWHFDHWDIPNHAEQPNSTTDSVWFDLGTTGDSVTAVFAPDNPAPIPLVVIFQPPNGGTAIVNGTPVSVSGSTVNIPFGTQTNISATPNGGFTFGNWILAHNKITPTDTSVNAQFCMNSPDTLTVVFRGSAALDTFDVVVQAFPGNGGTVTVNGNIISTFPTTIQVPDGTVLNCTATPNGGFAFIAWHVVYAATLPNDSANPMNCTIHGTDTIYAFFLQLPPPIYNLYVQAISPGGDSVSVNGTHIGNILTTLQFQDGTVLNDTAIPTAGHQFWHWYLVYDTLYPNADSSIVNFTIHQNDTLYGYFIIPDSFNIYVDISPNPYAGTVAVGGILPPQYPWLFRIDSSVANLDFSSTGLLGYQFVQYHFLHHVPSPNDTTADVFIHLTRSDSVMVYFKYAPIDTSAKDTVLVPTGFSPNDDGVNDVFRAFGTLITSEFHMVIYNRWGQKIFESHNQDYGWNGYYNNKKCDMGVYPYILTGKRTDESDFFQKGTITLIR